MDEAVVWAVCDELWTLSAERGAVSLIGEIKHEMARRERARRVVKLSVLNENLFSRALDQVRARQH
jgi:hypothetical protein